MPDRRTGNHSEISFARALEEELEDIKKRHARRVRSRESGVAATTRDAFPGTNAVDRTGQQAAESTATGRSRGHLPPMGRQVGRERS